MKVQNKNGYPPACLLHLQSLRQKAVRELAPLTADVAVTSEPVPLREKDTLPYRRLRPNEIWAKHVYDCGWFHIRGALPAGAEKNENLALRLQIGGEGLVYANDGTPYEMISAKMVPVDMITIERGKTLVKPDELLMKDGRIDFYMDAGFNGAFFIMPFGAGIFHGASVVEIDPELYAFYYDYLAVLSLFASLPKGEGAELLQTLKAAYQTAAEKNTAAARALLAPTLHAGAEDFTLYAVGHSHLDLAWLWPIRETKRKAMRTFTKQLTNIERYPDYIYGASQPWQFEYLKNNQPALWQRIKTQVENGKIEPQGGMYVEADTNLSGGEALIRQFYYGKQFFREAFGQDMRICWLPDVFGYNGNLPQILRGCGIDYFFTIKLSWNEHNKFPHRSFNWRGIDGSSVLVHMAPDETYTSDALPASARHARENYPEKDVSNEALYVYGVGDGGGGPGEAFLELLNRQSALAQTPKVQFSTALDFFKVLETRRDALPSFQGELYLEKHQGTYTTQARNKKLNRQTEFALEDLESLCTAAWLKGRPYPQEKLDEWWKETLLYQFHDIIPGSSIGRVYKESVEGYETMLRGIEAEKLDALRFLCGSGENDLVYDPLTFAARKAAPPSEDEQLFIAGDLMRNSRLTVRFNPDGEICSLQDAQGTEYADGYLNRLKLFFDRPLFYNAWDIDWKYHNLPGKTLKAYRSERKAEKDKVTRINYYRHGKTQIRQEISLCASDDTVKISTFADWHETFQMLRAEFLPAVRSDTVACDIQYGTIRRSTGDKTSEEKAQFEICAHKYVDVSDGAKGFSLLNDCKYGHRVKEGLLSLNLLRSPVFPDPHADRGPQEFTYALFPHKGGLSEQTLKRAYRLNKPELPFKGGSAFASAVSVSGDGVILALIKKAYRKDAVVVRLFESQGKEATAALNVNFDCQSVEQTDLLEENAAPVDPKKLTFRPFEIKTIQFNR